MPLPYARVSDIFRKQVNRSVRKPMNSVCVLLTFLVPHPAKPTVKANDCDSSKDAITVIGWAISQAAIHKTCPQCSESMKLKALKMQALRHEFGLPAQFSLSEPLYK